MQQVLLWVNFYSLGNSDVYLCWSGCKTHLSQRDVYVTPSERWGDQRAKLLHGHAWEQLGCTLDLAATAEPELKTMLFHGPRGDGLMLGSKFDART